MKHGIHFTPQERAGVDRLPPDTHCLDYPVRYDPELFQYIKSDEGKWEKKSDLAQAKWFHRRPYIAVGPNWFKLTGPEQWAVLLHEAGHLHYRHTWKRLPYAPIHWLKVSKRLAWRQELEADSFVAENGYGAAMLKYLFRYRNVREPKNSLHPELNFRMAHLVAEIEKWRRQHEMAA